MFILFCLFRSNQHSHSMTSTEMEEFPSKSLKTEWFSLVSLLLMTLAQHLTLLISMEMVKLISVSWEIIILHENVFDHFWWFSGEFVQLMFPNAAEIVSQLKRNFQSVDDVEKIFKTWDLNGDNAISFSEIQVIIIIVYTYTKLSSLQALSNWGK